MPSYLMKTASPLPLPVLTGASLLLAMLVACAPVPTSFSEPGNLTLEMRRLGSELARQEQRLDQLAQRLDSAEDALQRQEADLAVLRQELMTTAAADHRAAPHIGAPSYDSEPGMSGGQTPTEIYLQAFGDYASGRYPQAVEGFRRFLQLFPTNSYASNARFWLGDCYFNQQDYAKAIETFQQGLNDYPQAPRNPDALLKIAMAHLQLGNHDEARQVSDRLLQLYPDSAAAKKVPDLHRP